MYLESANNLIKKNYISNWSIFFSGLLAGTIFAPIYFWPGLFSISYLCYRIFKANSAKESAILGLKFGVAYYLVSIYWISLAIRVYIDDFWWALPFAIFGLPLLLSIFFIAICYLSYFFKNNFFYPLFFSVIWCFIEWVSSWFLTGFPWALVGYSFCNNLSLIQIVNLVGIYGLSLIIVFIFANLYYIFTKEYYKLLTSLVFGLLIIFALFVYGNRRLVLNPTRFSNIKIRLVQPSIPQTDKWEKEILLDNLNLLSKLTRNKSLEGVDIVIWPESALVLPINNKEIKKFLTDTLKNSKAILITGSVDENGKAYSDDFKLYTAMQGINFTGELLFSYYKSHLVPFGEYMPFSNFLVIKKLTHGFIDYSPGKREIIFLPELNLYIKPLICYEAIFPELVRYKIDVADVIINVTNDAWYGNSSGPYQHLQINVIRAIESGVSLIRSGNNGITAIIDPVGRIANKIKLNNIDFIDSNIPLKLSSATFYARFGEIMISIVVILLAAVQLSIYLVQKKLD